MGKENAEIPWNRRMGNGCGSGSDSSWLLIYWLRKIGDSNFRRVLHFILHVTIYNPNVLTS
jgi:hypothetical protein